MPDDIQEDTEALKARLAAELADAPQGTRDSEMPMPSDPNSTGQTGPSPTENVIPPGDPAVTGSGVSPGETGEEPDPGVFDAGGVNATNADGMSRTHPGGE